VSIDQPTINYTLNCGNLAAAAAAYAVDERLVDATEPVTPVRIYNTNTDALILAKVPVACGRSLPVGDYRIDGVPGTGAPIELKFLGVAGRATGRLLPTGHVSDRIRMADGTSIDVSIVDTGNVYVFVAAADLNLRGDESPSHIEGDAALAKSLQWLIECSTGLVNEAVRAPSLLAVHKLALVAPEGTEGGTGDSIADFAARIVSSNGKAHRAFAVTGAICAASAAFMAGSVVNRVLRRPPQTPTVIAHPQGRIEVDIECSGTAAGQIPVNATIKRTARRIMQGHVSIDRSAVADPVSMARPWSIAVA
jgi:2-methylaconitate cis-trans-isomerase PrpF